MAGESTSPNMLLPIPGVGVTAGPQYATDLDNCLTIIDGHDHSPGHGVPINQNGIELTGALNFRGQAASGLEAVVFQSQSVAPSLLGALYEDAGGDLFYIDGLGRSVQISQNGSIVGTSGSITGLPSGTAGVAYLSGTYTFSSATNTPASIKAGTYLMGQSGVSGSNYLTLQPPSALSSGSYTLTLPPIPGSQAFLSVDTSGNIVGGPDFLNGLLGGASGNIAVGTITGSAAGTGGFSNFRANTISGLDIERNTSLSGWLTLEGVAVTTGSVSLGTGNGLVIVRGTVEFDGSILQGEGFTVSGPSGGVYVITFVGSVPFTSPPSVVVSLGTSASAVTAGDTIFCQTPITTSTVNVQIENISSAAIDRRFNFIAIGLGHSA